ncbi:hypothetical protein D9599_23185 [Roseomonas sp. KE2513]|uniref:hypothetical protein n=1 Tax=Roseomonas sp. KE2513 TaxID=2479202 RepID=UPI0018DF88C3|nr:hypothetical protein [Roseomonas sp. KE2513]MBI0538472.1 hypothetical protein [Roseomonas sp. KE2513]
MRGKQLNLAYSSGANHLFRPVELRYLGSGSRLQFDGLVGLSLDPQVAEQAGVEHQGSGWRRGW